MKTHFLGFPTRAYEKHLKDRINDWQQKAIERQNELIRQDFSLRTAEKAVDSLELELVVAKDVAKSFKVEVDKLTKKNIDLVARVSELELEIATLSERDKLKCGRCGAKLEVKQCEECTR